MRGETRTAVMDRPARRQLSRKKRACTLQCDLCEKAAASVFCAADDARLCGNCDVLVHGANFLVRRHIRSPLCLMFAYLRNPPSSRCANKQEEHIMHSAVTENCCSYGLRSSSETEEEDEDIGYLSSTNLSVVHHQYPSVNGWPAKEEDAGNEETEDRSEADERLKLAGVLMADISSNRKDRRKRLDCFPRETESSSSSSSR